MNIYHTILSHYVTDLLKSSLNISFTHYCLIPPTVTGRECSFSMLTIRNQVIINALSAMSTLEIPQYTVYLSLSQKYCFHFTPTKHLFFVLTLLYT